MTNTANAPAVARRMAALLALLASAATPWAASSSAASAGAPTYAVYTSESMGHHSPINDLALDALGRLVVAAGNRIVLYDGNGWLNYLPENRDRADELVLFAVEKAADQALYAASNQGLFRISLQPNRRYRLEPIGDASRPQRQLRNAFRDADSLYFYSHNDVFRYRHDLDSLELLSPPSPTTFSSMAVQQGVLYAFEVGGDVHAHLGGRQWKRIASAASGSFSQVVRAAAPWGQNELLLARDTSGLYHLGPNGFAPWSTEINALDSKRVLAIEPLSSQRAAISLDSQGIALVNRHGHVEQMLSRQLDHRFGKAKRLLPVGESTVWAATGDALVRIDFQRPLTDFSLLLPVPSSFPRVFWRHDALHVVTDEKLLRARSFQGGALRDYRQLAPGLPGILNALSVSDGILLATTQGVYLLDDHDAITPLCEKQEVSVLVAHPSKPDEVLAAGAEHLRLLRREPHGWAQTELKVPTSHTAYFGITARPDEFWLEHGNGAVSRVSTASGRLQRETFHLGESFDGHWINIWNLHGRLIFNRGRSSPFLQWNQQTHRFEPADHPLLQALAQAGPGITRPAVDAQGNLWATATAHHAVLRPSPTGDFTVDRSPLRRVQNEPLLRAVPRPDGSIWLVGEQSILRYDPNRAEATPATPPPTLYAVEDIKDQSFLDHSPTGPLSAPLQLPFARNSLRFHFTSPALDASRDLAHEYRIPGYIDAWTASESPTQLTLDNLPAGAYRLDLRSVSPHAQPSQVASLGFAIRPPLVRHPAALALYALLALALALLLATASRRLSERKNRALQRLVDVRTRELAMANGDLQLMVRRAESATAAKSAFLNNVSHELRTPLNHILGPSSLLLADSPRPEDRQLLSAIHQAAERMLDMVEKLTSLSELSAESDPIEAAPFDLGELCHEKLEKHRTAANQKALALSSSIDPKLALYRAGDRARIGQCLDILLENAIKFTDSGSVALRVSAPAKGAVSFEVSDTGCGINAKLRDRIFEPFFQLEPANPSALAKNEGAGIGLSICRQLVAALDGDIEVESIEGRGAVFRVTLPLPSACPKRPDMTPPIPATESSAGNPSLNRNA